MKSQKGKSSSLDSGNSTFFKSVNDLRYSLNKEETLTNIFNRKLIITKYPQSLESSVSKGISKTLKQRRKVQSRNNITKQTSQKNQQKPLSNQWVLKSDKIKVLVTRKGERTPQKSIKKQKVILKPQVNYRVLPLISQINYQLKEERPIQNKKTFKISPKKPQKISQSTKQFDCVINDRITLDGWNSTMALSHNPRSQQYFYQMDESNDLQDF